LRGGHRAVVDVRARLLAAPALRERAGVHRGEAELFDQAGDRCLGLLVVACHEDRMALRDRQVGAASRGEVLVVDRVERLDEPRARKLLCGFLARARVSQVEEASDRRVGTRRVDHDLPLEELRIGELPAVPPRQGQQDNVSERDGLLDRRGPRLPADGGDQRL
jgi:hypothetical protein